jgi:hypothetical protein
VPFTAGIDCDGVTDKTDSAVALVVIPRPKKEKEF